MKDILQKLLAAFDVEHREHLTKLRRFLAGLEAGASMDGPRVEIIEAFRCAHSLKGASRVVDLKTISELAHRMESLFSKIQSGKQAATPEFLSIMGQVLDLIEDTVIASRAGETIPDAQPLLHELDQLLKGDNSIAPVLAPPSPSPSPAPEPTPSPIGLAPLVPEALLKATSPDAVQSIPAPPLAASKPLTSPAATPRAATGPLASPSFDTMRLSAEHFDRLIKTAGEVISFSRNQEENANQLKDMTQIVRGMEKEWGLVQKHSAQYMQQIATGADRTRLGKYLSFVESQMRLLGRQLRAVSQNQKNDNFTLRLLGEQLQGDVQTARLIPAHEVFDTFGKMMRDLAKDEGKSIDFRMSGMDVEADRVVLQALKDPLMHMLRNALSHGIEAAEEREAAQKIKQGRIQLSLEIAARRLTLVIEDDGKGISVDRLRTKALEAGLIPIVELESMSDEELRELIFHPGFSTADQITEISGRGVGLSVVKDAIERLQGDVTIESEPGSYCRFKISVPLSLSTHRLLLMKSQGQTLAIPTHSVQSVQRAKAKDLSTIEGRPVLKVKGVYVPVMALSLLLGMKDHSVKSSEDALAFAVIKSGEKRLAIAVDTLIGEREGLIKDLGAPLTRSNRFSGGLLLDRDSIALVLNPPALFEAYYLLRGGHPLKIAQRKEERQKLKILVVDDSFTTRILEKSILEAKGYHVSVAVDGLEALAFLNTHEVDLIISDVEMPRMDGLGLLQQVKANPKLAKIPVIMVSSRNEREDQERGLRLGADAYLPKQDFNQSILLDTIRQVI